MKLEGVTPSVRKEFRANERERLSELELKVSHFDLPIRGRI